MKHLKSIYILITILLFPFIGWFGNRQRGMDTDKRFMKLPKLVWYFIFGLMDASVLFLVISSVWGLAWYVSILIAILSGFLGHFILLSPSWGELFKHVDKDTSQEDYAFGVAELTTAIKGYDHTKDLWDSGLHYKILDWKQTGMSVRWFLYSIPKYTIYSIACLHVLPLLAIPSMWLVGVFYGKQFDKQNKKGGPSQYNAVEHAEPWVGAYLKFIDALILGIILLV